MMPVVSVIIPTCNRADYLPQALASVFAQTFTDYEVIVIDDGDPRITEPVVRPHIASGRIQYFTQQNQGAGPARNNGAARAGGSLLAFLDDDDFWPPDKLAWQTESLARDPAAAAVVGSCQYVDVQARRIADSPVHGDNLDFDSLFDRNPIISPGQTLIRADALRQAGGFDTDMRGTEDLDFWFKLTHQSRVLMVNRLALFYRMHSAGVSRDLRLMLRNLRRVGSRHLQSVPQMSRRRARRRFDRYLYRYIGGKLVRQFKTRVRRGEFRAARQSLLGISSLFACALRTPDVPARLLRDLFLRYWNVPVEPASGVT
jgi:glycosyltransferase involved in cell wall biosynthesis